MLNGSNFKKLNIICKEKTEISIKYTLEIDNVSKFEFEQYY